MKKRSTDSESDKGLSRMSFSEHFEELRKRLVYCAVSVFLLFIVCYIFKDYLVGFVLHPYNAFREEVVASGKADPGALIFIGLQHGFLFYLKACFMASLFLSAPVLLTQMWLFIGAGLYSKEKGSILRVVPFSILLFLLGLAFGYFVLFPIGMEFLLSFPNPAHMSSSITVSLYFDLFFMMILIMGFVFQAPLIMVVTTSIGLTTPELFTTKRRYFLLGAFVCAALFTPPDAITQCLLAGPLVVLFEAGILLSKGVVKKKKAAEVKTGGVRSGAEP
jgi:sec-independent protein translocase protein TatC